MDKDFELTENEDEAAYIHFTSFTINEYFCLGQVLNHIYANGDTALDVVLEKRSVWNVTAPSLGVCTVSYFSCPIWRRKSGT